jgi:ADP-ribosylglycohydrolase
MTNDTETRKHNRVLGALVADAAAVGTHWIYDQDHIRKIAPEAPEFMTPDAANYDGVMAYFAHPNRKNGDQSQYGEQLIVMLKALEANDGVYDAHIYASQFRAHFGYGGAYVGYIDHATRETLNNFQRAEDEALKLARALPYDGEPKVTTAMIGKALAAVVKYDADTLQNGFEADVRATHNDDAIMAHALNVLDVIRDMPPLRGAHDEQLPAIAKLPGLVASMECDVAPDAFFDAIDSAVRTTSDHERAIAFGRVSAAMMWAASTTDNMNEIVIAGRAVATPETGALLADAIDMTDQDTNVATKHFGMACDLNYGVPSVVHNMLTAPTYQEAIRRNIYAGGDTCGRAMLIGAVMGAVHGIGGEQGIPKEWIENLSVDRNLSRYL